MIMFTIKLKEILIVISDGFGYPKQGWWQDEQGFSPFFAATFVNMIWWFSPKAHYGNLKNHQLCQKKSKKMKKSPVQLAYNPFPGGLNPSILLKYIQFYLLKI